MARTITDEEIRLNIVINGNEAQRELHQLERSTINLKEANKALNAEKRRLEAQGQRNTQRYRELSAEIARNNTTIDTNRARMNQLQDQIGITGLSMAQLRQRATILRASLSNMIPGSADFVRVQGELSAINARLGELSGRAVTARSAIAALADGFNRYAALGASVFGVLTGMALSIQKVIDLNGKLSDAQANVQKTTGMTKEEVDELTKSFSQLNTRTSKIDLLGIAEVGGQLGVAKGDIGEFVEVMNKAGVALGSSFEGGVKAVAEKLGKIKGLYAELGDVSIKTAFESVGSAMNDLAAQGTATEQNIADFVTRVGAMPAALKPSIEESLGLAAAFEETGLKAELAAGNYSKVISIGAKSTSEFAKVMKMSKKEVEDLINSDPNEFFLKFAESLKGMNATQMAQTLDTLKLNDNEVKMVLGSAMDNIDLFRKKIEVSTRSMADATSMTREYEVMNNTLQATLEKVYKKMTGIFTSETLVKFLLGAVTWFAKLIGVTEDTTGRFATFRVILVNLAKVFAIVLAAMVTNVTWQKLVFLWTNRNTESTILYNLALKAKMVAERIATVFTQGYIAVTSLLTLNLRGATVALRAMTTAMATTPWGLVLMGITAIVTAYAMYSKELTNAEKVQKSMNDLHLKAKQEIAKEVSELELLVSIARDTAYSYEQRVDAIKKINAISPEYLKNITLENINTAESRKQIDLYIASLEAKALAQAAAARLTELETQKLAIQAKALSEYQGGVSKFLKGTVGKDVYDMESLKKQSLEFVKTLKGRDGKLLQQGTEAFQKRYELEIRNRKALLGDYLEEKDKELDVIEKEKKATLELLKTRQDDIKNNTNTEYTDTPYTPATPTPNSNQETAEQRRERLENERKQREDMLKQMTADELQLKREAEDAKLALMAEGLEKELLQEQYFHERKIADLQKQLISESEIQAALKKANNEKLSQDERAFFQKQADYWIAENKHRNTLIESEEAQHLYRKNTIATKYDTERIKKMEEQYNREKTVREASYLEEIVGKNLSEEELKIAREEFDKAEIEQYKKHIDATILELEKLILVKKEALETSTLPKDSALYQNEVENLQRLTDETNKLKLAKLRLKTGEGESNDLLSGMGGITDIFGFSPDHWEKLFQNLENGVIGVQEIGTAVMALTNIWGQYNKIVSANEQKQIKSYEINIDKRKKSLKQALDNGWITQKEYNERVEKMEQDLAEKKAKMEYEQAVRERDMAVINSLINTAVAVTKVIDRPWLAVAVGLAGAIQTGIIASQEIPTPQGFEEGYYPVKREQDGKVFQAKRGGIAKSGMVNRPTHFLAGENGQFFPEMIIDGKSFKNFSPQLKENLYNELNGMRGFEKGYIPSIQTQNISDPKIDKGNSNLALEMLIKENVAILREIKEEGILAVVSDKDFRSIDKLNKAQDRLRQIKDKTKVVG